MSSDVLAKQLELLPHYLGQHLLITLASLVTGIVLCLPLAFLATRLKWLQSPLLTFASIMQTIPGLAMLALMVPILGMIGFLPAFVALVLYSMLPVLRNTVTGILGVDASVVEAAKGIGMTSTQILFRVEVPLALPVIIAGIRTSAVWVVGTATLATPVGATSLGNYIFGGLQTQNSTAVLVGCAAAAFLAIILDRCAWLVEISVSKRNQRYAYVAAFGLIALTGFSLLPILTGVESRRGNSTIVIGAKPFTEQYILAEALKRQLEDGGINATVKSSLGSSILFDALAGREIDCCVDYTGTLWANVLKRQNVPSRDSILVEVTRWLNERHGIMLVGPLGFENTYALATSAAISESLGIYTLDQLAKFSPQLRMGSDYEFFSRPEWTRLKETYGLAFADLRVFDPTLMYAGIEEKQVDVISAYSTDGRIAAQNLVVLEDTRKSLPPYDAVVLLSSRAASDRTLVGILTPLIGVIDDGTMREANKVVDVDKRSVEAGADFLLKRVRGQQTAG
jgi:osmoprotectant transport system permease protein